MCKNRIVMNIIKAKCLSNQNMFCLGVSEDYKEYLDKSARCGIIKSLLSEEEFLIVKDWSKGTVKPPSKEDLCEVVAKLKSIKIK